MKTEANFPPDLKNKKYVSLVSLWKTAATLMPVSDLH